jgi:hypothetical protein
MTATDTAKPAPVAPKVSPTNMMSTGIVKAMLVPEIRAAAMMIPACRPTSRSANPTTDIMEPQSRTGARAPRRSDSIPARGDPTIRAIVTKVAANPALTLE